MAPAIIALQQLIAGVFYVKNTYGICFCVFIACSLRGSTAK